MEEGMAPIRSFVSRILGAALVCVPTGLLASNECAVGLNQSQAQQTIPAQNVIAVAFPSDAQQGDTITGTVTADPREIEELQQIPGLQVTLYPVPKATQPAQPAPESQAGSTLEGLVVEVNGEKHPADKPLIAKLGPETVSIALKLVMGGGSPRQIGERNVPIAKKPSVPKIPTQTPSASDCDMPAVTTPGAVQVIHGPSTGNANDMQITADNK